MSIENKYNNQYFLNRELECEHYIRVLERHTPEPGTSYCNSTFDSFSCWPTTRTGQVVSLQCPDVSVTNPEANVTRECYDNGTWAMADYNICMTGSRGGDAWAEKFPFRSATYSVRIIYDIGFSITTLVLIVALVIFLNFRSLRCLRNSIHCNLILAFILSNIVWLIVRNTLTEKRSLEIEWFCNLMLVLATYFGTAPFYWMFVEGLYLFTIVVWAFSAQNIRLWYYLIIGWVIPVVPTVCWAVLKKTLDDNHCLFHNDGPFDYIVHGPVLFFLASNICFVVAIIWVLVTKMKATNTLETRQSRKAVKATIVLVPLLGLTYVLFLYPPSNTHAVSHVFRVANAVLQSTQGLFVAIFYCFLNGEVRSLLRQRLHALQESRTLSRYTKSSLFGSPRRSSCYAMALTCNGKNGSGPGHQKSARLGETETEASALMIDRYGPSTDLAGVGARMTSDISV